MERFAKVMALFAVFVLTLFVFDKLQPGVTTVTEVPQVTTYTVYEVRQLQWTFNEPMGYGYDESLINLSGGEAKLKLQKILKELKNQTPLTIPLKGDGGSGSDGTIPQRAECAIGQSPICKYNKKHEFKSAAYSYKGTLKTLSFDADKPSQTSVKLKIRTAGTQQALEGAEWQPKGRDYYTTSPQDISGVAGGPNGYVQYKAVLETDDDARTPTLNSVTITYETEEYPIEAAISTKEYAFSRSVEIQALTTEEELKGQTVKYEYSTDSGNSWKEPVSGQILAAAADKIAVKAILGSDGAETPAVKDIKLSYRISICDEKWQANYTSCSKSDTRTKYYADANACGSKEDLPADNGTTESCDYCTPQWTNLNGSCRSDDTIAVNYFHTNSCCDETGLQSDCTIPQNTTAQCDFCTPNWAETNNSCSKDDRISATFTDTKSCYATTGLPSDNAKPQNRTYNCDYCTPSFVCGSYSDCSENNQKTCVQANDTNDCYRQTGVASDSYSGNFSEFAASCAYDTEKPSVNSAIAAAIGNTLTVMANITDKSPITAVAHIIKDNNVVMNLTLTNTNVASGIASNIYTASANAAELSGAYIVSISAKDAYNNTATAKGAAGVTINAEKSAMKEIVLNSTGKALIVLTNSATIEVNGKTAAAAPSAAGRIVVAGQTTDIRNTTKPQDRKELGRYIEIEADEALKSNVSSATLKISYSDEEVAAANVSETSLTLYYYNETSSLWQGLSSAVNTVINYVEGNTTHLSLFGIFGNEQNQANPAVNTTVNATTNQTAANQTANQTAPGGGEQQQPQQQQQQQQETPTEPNAAATAGGGGGAAEKTKENAAEQNQDEKEAGTTAELNEAVESCTYDVRLELAGSPSFINKTRTNATLTNTGTCALQNIEVKATPPLDAYIVIENGEVAELKPSESFGFAIKLKTAAEAALQAQLQTQQQKQPVQGFVVKEPRKATTRNGKIVITGQGVKGRGLNAESGELQLMEVPINIEVYELEQNGSKSSIAATAIGILVLITLLGMLYSRVTRRRSGRGNSDDNSNSETSHLAAAEAEKEKGFEEGLKRFEEKWKQGQKEKQNLFNEKDLPKTEFGEKAQVGQQNQHEKSLEGFRETFK